MGHGGPNKHKLLLHDLFPVKHTCTTPCTYIHLRVLMYIVR